MEDLFPKLRLAFGGLPCKETVYIGFSFQNLGQWEIKRDYNCLLFLPCCAVPRSEWNKSFLSAMMFCFVSISAFQMLCFLFNGYGTH